MVISRRFLLLIPFDAGPVPAGYPYSAASVLVPPASFGNYFFFIDK
jgi:hypothetical protein